MINRNLLLLTGSSDCDEEWRDSPQPEHGQKWVGAYDGAADVYWCSTGTEEGSVAAFLDIRRMEGSRVQVALTVVSGAENLFGHLVYGAAEAPVRHTIARGRILLEDFRHTTLDPVAIARAARVEAFGLWERFRELGASGNGLLRI